MPTIKVTPVVAQEIDHCGGFDAETPTMIRLGDRTSDEFFVSEAAARAGVVICYKSEFDPLVMLKHFADNCLHLV